MLSSSASSDASASRNCSRPRNALFWLRSTSHRTHSSGRETPPTERTEHTEPSGREAPPTEPTERTEPSGREAPPTDAHGCAQIRRVWHPAIPTLPPESSSLSSALPTVRARTAPTKQAGISPTERTEHTEPSGREAPPTEPTERTEPSGREAPPTDAHGCAQIRRVWHPAIPTLPPESSSLSSALPTVRARTAPTKQAGINPTECTEHTEPSGREAPPTDAHGCAQIKRVWHPAVPTQPTAPPNFCEFRGRTDATKPSVQIREICGRTYATKLL